MSSYPLSNSATSISDILDEEVDGAVSAMPVPVGSEMMPMLPPPSQSSLSVIGSTPSPSSSVSSSLPPSSSSLSSTPPSQSIATVQVKGNRLSVQLHQNGSCKVKRYNVALDLPSASKGSDKSVDASITRVDLVNDGTTSEHCVVGHCTVCLVRRCDCVFLPCGHIKTCMKCGSNLYLRRMKCPVCRKVMKLRPYKVYM